MQRYSILSGAAAVIFGLGAVACGDGNDGDAVSQSGSIGSAQTTDDGGEESTDASAEQGEASTSGDASDSDADDTSTDDGGAEETSTGGPSCEQADYDFELAPTPPNVMLVLDKSRSMSNLWDHDIDSSTPDISRWHSLHNVVSSLTDQFSGRINFGAQLFPSAAAYLDEPTNQFSCMVEPEPEVGVGADTAAAIMAALPAAEDFSISGGTPAVAGLSSAIEHLLGLPEDAPRAVLLLTDGAANCSDNELPEDTLFVYDDETPHIVASAFADHGIPTYVVGINILDQMETKPAVNPYEALNEVADAGGVAAAGVDHFYNSFNEVELIAALEQVADRIECTISLPDMPQFPEEVSVSVDGAAWPSVDDCAAGDGWVYTAPAGPFNAIQLCGTACEALQGGGTVGVDFGCPE